MCLKKSGIVHDPKAPLIPAFHVALVTSGGGASGGIWQYELEQQTGMVWQIGVA